MNGEETAPGEPFRAEDTPRPLDAYGVSKLEAEQGLKQIAAASGMEVVIIRPPLVYGPGVKANFLEMMRWVHKGLPLPLHGIHNKRSLIALDNLVSLILACIMHPAAGNQIFLAADGEDLSTAELLKRTGVAMNQPVRLFSVPTGMLMGVASMLGKRSIAQRLCGSLQVDISKARDLLDWSPLVSMDEALRRTTHYFLSTL